jgi:hypothetical protein
VGIYTTYRHDGRGYVSVGFPVPQGSFTATLLPQGRPEVALCSPAEPLSHPGHYWPTSTPPAESSLSSPYTASRAASTSTSATAISEAEHAFSVFGLPFLVLHYRMHRKPTAHTP